MDHTAVFTPHPLSSADTIPRPLQTTHLVQKEIKTDTINPTCPLFFILTKSYLYTNHHPILKTHKGSAPQLNSSGQTG